jgi:hypothetical protein
MGRRIMVLSDSFLAMLLSGGEHHYRVTGEGLPGDARVIGAQAEFVNWHCLRINLLIESAEWPEGAEGAAYPLATLQIEALYPKDDDFVPFSEAIKGC